MNAPSQARSTAAPPPTRAAASAGWPRLALALTVLASAVVRVVLVRNGGQFFWLDESFRFHPCLQIVDALHYPNHTWTEIADVIARQHLHTGFLLVGTPVTAIAKRLTLTFQLASVERTAAMLLSGASVACIALVYAIARRVEATRWEGWTAAFLMAATNCIFYYSRHLLPYDSALALGLLALWWGLHPRWSLPRSFLLGVMGGTAYLIYFGYLTLVLAVMAICLLRQLRSRWVVAHALAIGVGFLVLPLAMHAFTLVHSAGGVPFLNDLLALMQLANQGGYEEGWLVPWAYLWLSEHGLLLVWMAGAVGVVALAWRGGVASRRRGMLWLALVGLIYAQLALNSTVLHKSVVLGRFARQLVPFLCLATAAAVRDLADRRPLSRVAWAAATAAIVLQAAVNFSVPLRQWFVPEMEQQVAESYGTASLTRDMSVLGPEWDQRIDRSARFVLLNTVTFPYPAKAIAPPIAGRVVLRHEHPLQFIPYQYEVYDAAGRHVLQSADLSMRLIDTAER
jgi:hypothetical protein